MRCTATEAMSQCVLNDGHDGHHIWQDARPFRKPSEYHKAGIITAKELQVLELRYTHGLSQWTTALALECSRSTVRGVEKRALQKINLHQRGQAA